MVTPSKDLSRHFDYSKILASVGISVKGVIPELTKCPRCLNNSLSVHLDLDNGSSRWLRCSKCNLKGDPLDVLCAIKNTNDVTGLIYAAARDGLCTIPPEELTPTSIQSYLETYPEHRSQNQEIWDYMTSMMTTDKQRPELTQRIQRDHLWNGWNTKGQQRFAQFLGAAHRKELIAKFNFGKSIPRYGFNTFLCLNCQDIPGRTCAFYLMGDTETHLCFPNYKDIGTNDDKNGDGGLAFLDTLTGADQTVFVTSDYRTALQLQRKKLNQSEDPLKILIYNHATRRAWSHVSAEKIIFWNPEIDIEVFVQVRLVRNGFIATKPALTKRKPDEMYQYISEEPIQTILARMEASAVPWPRALATWLTDPHRPELDIHTAFARLGLNTEEREALLTECNVSDRDRLKAFLGLADARLRHVVLGHRSFIERDEKWYHLHSDRREEMIADTIFRLTRESLDPFAETAYWSGEIRHNTHRIKVDGVPIDEIKKDPAGWITRQMIKAGIKVPYFESSSKFTSFNHIFMGLVRKFSSYETVTLATKIGILPDGTVMMPAFNIAGGKVSAADDVLVRLTPIASGVRPPIPRATATISESVFPTRVRWTLMAAAFVTNWLAEFKNVPVTPVAVSGDMGTVSGEALEHFVRTSGMRREKLARQTYSAVDDMIASMRTYNYPTYVDMTGSKSVPLWPTKTNGNFLARMSAMEAAAMGTNQTWIHIFGSAYRHDAYNLPPFDDILMYLMQLQKRQYQLDYRTTMFDTVLSDMCLFFGRYIPGINAELLYKNANRSYVHYHNPGDCLIELAAWLFQSGRIIMDTTEEETPPARFAYGLLHNPAKNWIYISRAAIYEGCQAARSPIPDLYRAEQDLKGRECLAETGLDKGILVKQEIWDTQLKLWKHRFQTPPADV